MGKPSSVYWIGVGEEVQVEVRGLTFEVIDYGSLETADPGDFAGFGVEFDSDYYDSGASEVDLDALAEKARTILAAVKVIFQEWGMTIEPKVFRMCCYSG